jgi:plasmid stabilization system protein ParE
MSAFKIVISAEAVDDITDLFNYIAFEICNPITAERYREGLMETIDRLSCYADLFALSSYDTLRQLYGADVRTVRYKKMTIVYNIIGNVAYIRRVMAGSLIR